MAYAVSADLIGRSPCRDIRLPHVGQSDRRPLSANDVGAIAGTVDERYRAMIWIGALLGLRWGEVAGLRVGRLDLKGRTLTVAEIVTRDDHGRPMVGPPKSVAGIRTLSVPAVLVKVLRDHLKAQKIDLDERQPVRISGS